MIRLNIISLSVAPKNGRVRRLVIARCGEAEVCRDTFDTDNRASREKFIKHLATKSSVDEVALLGVVDQKITQAADAADLESIDAAKTTPLRKHSRPIVKFNSSTTEVAELLASITAELVKSGDCFTRSGQLVVLRDGHPFAITKATELAGVFSRTAEFAFVAGEMTTFEPLPMKFANTWLNNHNELAKLPAINVFSRCPMYTQGYRLVEPGFDQESEIFYAGPTITPKKENTNRLNAMLAEFCFRSPGDRTNYIGLLLTSLLMSKFIGSHPAGLYNANQPELGKTMLAQIGAIIRTGEPAPTVSYNSNDEEFEKSLGSRIKEGTTDLIIDNAKDKGGRNAVVGSAVLERSITDHVLSFACWAPHQTSAVKTPCSFRSRRTPRSAPEIWSQEPASSTCTSRATPSDGPSPFRTPGIRPRAPS